MAAAQGHPASPCWPPTVLLRETLPSGSNEGMPGQRVWRQGRPGPALSPWHTAERAGDGLGWGAETRRAEPAPLDVPGLTAKSGSNGGNRNLASVGGRSQERNPGET